MSNPTFKNFIFDFDGTLADTFAFAVEGINRLSKKYHYRSISPDELPRLRYLTAKELIKILEIPPLRAPFIYREGLKMLHNEIHNVSLVLQSLGRTLKRLKFEHGVRLGIVTSNSKKNVRAFLEVHRLLIFDFIISSSSLWGKHHTLQKAIRTAGLKPDDTLYVGDEIRDIQAARGAGIAIAAVSWGYNTIEALRANQPDFLFQSPDDLLTIARTECVPT